MFALVVAIECFAVLDEVNRSLDAIPDRESSIFSHVVLEHFASVNEQRATKGSLCLFLDHFMSD